MCPKKRYVSGVRARVVPSKGSDDYTAMNDILLKYIPIMKPPQFHTTSALKVTRLNAREGPVYLWR